MNDYIGNPLQIRGAEKYILEGGKGNGMHFLYIRNGLGLEAWISLDRAGDISRITYNGKNIGYFSPCGYVSPAFYDKSGTGFLKSFTAGFFTTCGLTAVGTPCIDEGEELPLHGTISNTPSELNGIEETDSGLVVKLTVTDASLFGRKLVMKRTYTFSYTNNSFDVSDTITNIADTVSPCMILYHCNMGYPLLNENSIIKIPALSIAPRNEYAQKYISSALQPEKPQANFEECCYYFDVKENNGLAKAGILSTEIDTGVIISYDKNALPYFTEWKMMGKAEYVLGLEPGNCTPDGRDVLREKGMLELLNPDQSKTTSVSFVFTDKKQFEEEFD